MVENQTKNRPREPNYPGCMNQFSLLQDLVTTVGGSVLLLDCVPPAISMELSLSGGVTPCRHLRPSSGQEHTVVKVFHSGDDDYLMNETRKPTTSHDALLFAISGTGSFICRHTDTAGHTKAFDSPVTQTRLDIPRPLITQSHRHGWTYQGL